MSAIGRAWPALVEAVGDELDHRRRLWVLEAGAGARTLFDLREDAYVVGVDRDPWALAGNARLDERVLADIARYLPRATGFDLINSGTCSMGWTNRPSCSTGSPGGPVNRGLVVLAVANLRSPPGLMSRLAGRKKLRRQVTPAALRRHFTQHGFTSVLGSTRGRGSGRTPAPAAHHARSMDRALGGGTVPQSRIARRRTDGLHRRLPPQPVAPYAGGVVSLRKAGRVFSPTGLILAGLCFALPFVTVGCDTPGGFGRAAPGGSATYTGFNLALGTPPSVTEDKVRPVPAGEPSDDLPPQPAAAVVLVLVVAAVGFAFRSGEPRVRRASVAVLAGVAATALLVNQALVEAEVTLRVSDHLTLWGQSGYVFPVGKAAHDYVQTGQGFGLCLMLLLVVAVINGIGWWRARPRPALVQERAT